MNDKTPITAAEREQKLRDGMEIAWGIIANAFGGDWDKASPEWRSAAERWRDEYWHQITLNMAERTDAAFAETEEK